jgi:osmotically-inducible protein OsmY
MGRLIKTVVAAAIGWSAAYLFDRDRGRARRARLRDQLAHQGRRARQAVGRRARYERGRLRGTAHRLTPGSGSAPADDHVLADRIRSQVLGPMRGHKINVDVADGVVTLRGEVDSAGDRAEIESRVQRVGGVAEVRNLLHDSGSPAPNKADALRT